MSGRGQIVLVVLGLAISIAVRQPLLFVVCLALLLAAGATWLWERYCLARVEYRREFSQRRAFFGEEVRLTIEIVNRKPLPLGWLVAEDELPRLLAPVGAPITPSHKPLRAVLSNLLALRPYERVRRHYRLRCEARGEFAFGPARLRSGDLFGFTSREADVPGEELLLVYPRIVPLAQLGLPARDPFGDRRARQWLFEDPLRTVGVRDYRPGDSQRRIHWAATARAQSLQVKLYEPTITQRLVVVLNLNTVSAAWWWPGSLPDLLELAVMTAASVANWAVEQGYSVGLAANGNARLAERQVYLPPSRDPEALTGVLEALARITPVATTPLADLLEGVGRRLTYGATLVVVSAVLDEAILAELLALQRRGHSLALLLIGEAAAPVGATPLRIHRIGQAALWRELQEIRAG